MHGVMDIFLTSLRYKAGDTKLGLIPQSSDSDSDSSSITILDPMTLIINKSSCNVPIYAGPIRRHTHMSVMDRSAKAQTKPTFMHCEDNKERKGETQIK